VPPGAGLEAERSGWEAEAEAEAEVEVEVEVEVEQLLIATRRPD